MAKLKLLSLHPLGLSSRLRHLLVLNGTSRSDLLGMHRGLAVDRDAAGRASAAEVFEIDKGYNGGVCGE